MESIEKANQLLTSFRTCEYEEAQEFDPEDGYKVGIDLVLLYCVGCFRWEESTSFWSLRVCRCQSRWIKSLITKSLFKLSIVCGSKPRKHQFCLEALSGRFRERLEQ